MKRRTCSLLFLGVSLTGPFFGEENPAIGKLNSTLLALKHTDSPGKMLERQQLVDEILLLVENDRQPSRSSVAAFVDEFVRALAGRGLTSAQVSALRRSIVEVTQSSGTTFVPASTLRETLTAVGVSASKAQLITSRFIVIGEEIRGPDDQRL